MDFTCFSTSVYPDSTGIHLKQLLYTHLTESPYAVDQHNMSYSTHKTDAFKAATLYFIGTLTEFDMNINNYVHILNVEA